MKDKGNKKIAWHDAKPTVYRPEATDGKYHAFNNSMVGTHYLSIVLRLLAYAARQLLQNRPQLFQTFCNSATLFVLRY